MKNIKAAILAVSLTALLAIIGCQQKQQPQQVISQQIVDVSYTCPMHPQIKESKPGNCPICGMSLIKRSGQASEGAGISLNTVLQPVSSSVVASINAISPRLKEVRSKISGEGYLDFDTRTFNNIAARFSGRIEKLYIKYAFEQIHTGQRIFDIYSPEIVAAQQDLLYLVKNSATDISLINAAKQKLLLSGMTNAQVLQVLHTEKPFYSLPVYSAYEGHVHDVAHTQMYANTGLKPEQNFSDNVPLAVKEGMYVEKGQNIFNVVDPHHLWAVIKIDRSSIAGLKLKQPVQITLPDMAGKTINGKVDFIEPFIQNGDKSISIRVYINDMGHELKVNSLVNASINAGTISGLWILRTAITNLGRTQIVWLKSGSVYKTRRVNVGVINGNDIQITKGLSQTDSIAINAQYLTDSEGFIKVKGDEISN